ncbi:MAG: hypothetical protein VKI81_05915 [Synechococcaceae cyanobacterium]|nr:hypothetical protein [Synechococcaceae cyanobacterium]
MSKDSHAIPTASQCTFNGKKTGCNSEEFVNTNGHNAVAIDWADGYHGSTRIIAQSGKHTILPGSFTANESTAGPA